MHLCTAETIQDKIVWKRSVLDKFSRTHILLYTAAMSITRIDL